MSKPSVKAPMPRLSVPIAKRLKMRAREEGFDDTELEEYVGLLLARGLKYKVKTLDAEGVRQWLSADEPELKRKRTPQLAASTLRSIYEGVPVTTKLVAEVAELTYQQAYRQLRRSAEVEQVDGRWVPRMSS